MSGLLGISAIVLFIVFLAINVVLIVKFILVNGLVTKNFFIGGFKFVICNVIST